MALTMEKVYPHTKLLSLEDLPITLPEQWANFDFGSEGQTLWSDGYEVGLDMEKVSVDQVGWTPQNIQFAGELNGVSESLPSLGHQNKILFTLQTCGIGNGLLAMRAQHQELLSLRDMPGDREELERERNTRLIGLGVGYCLYAEQYAYTTGIIPGLNPPNALLISALTRTIDGKLAFGIRKSEYAPGEGVFGGTYNTEPIPPSRTVPFPLAVQVDEIITETGVPATAISDIQMRGIIYDHQITKSGTVIERPVLFSEVFLNVTARQVEQFFWESEEAQKEHQGIVFVDNSYEGILEYLASRKPADLVAPAPSVLAIALRRTMGVARP